MITDFAQIQFLWEGDKFLMDCFANKFKGERLCKINYMRISLHAVSLANTMTSNSQKSQTLHGTLNSVMCCVTTSNVHSLQLNSLILGFFFGKLLCASVLAITFIKKTHMRSAYRLAIGMTLLLKKNKTSVSVERKVGSTFVWERIGKFKLPTVKNMHFTATLLSNPLHLLIFLEALSNAIRRSHRLSSRAMYDLAKSNVKWTYLIIIQLPIPQLILILWLSYTFQVDAFC